MATIDEHLKKIPVGTVEGMAVLGLKNEDNNYLAANLYIDALNRVASLQKEVQELRDAVIKLTLRLLKKGV